MPAGSPQMIWIGRACSALVVLVLLADAAVHLLMPERLADNMMAGGFQVAQTSTLGLLVLACALIYAVPTTTFLGAILTTAFLGGAICTHFRMGEATSPPAIICLVLGVLVWAGLYLRDPRVRSLLLTPAR
jgi:hypothetical protein